ncbi:MAG: hypothetical protein M1837_001135 [Sclerophora amabilis]|nr:MAG: hypothetical protein M1837_001135 [Sclerophora amabilis]
MNQGTRSKVLEISSTTSRQKRDRTTAVKSDRKTIKRLKPSINTSSSPRLDFYVIGSGDYGELGLGHVPRDGKKPKDVRRPRLNHLLDAETVGIIQIAVGGMHCVALTHDQEILTWGVNDDGALGRDSTWEAPTRDVEAESEDEGDDAGLNPRESTPTAFPKEFFGETARAFT